MTSASMPRWWAPVPDPLSAPSEWCDYLVMSATILGEAEGESLLGKRAVAWVIMNRVRDPHRRWPQTPSGACLQPQQFSCWDIGSPRLFTMFNPQRKVSEPLWEDCIRAAMEAIWRSEPDPTEGANHYLAPMAHPPAWADPDKVTAHIGQHTFYRL